MVDTDNKMSPEVFLKRRMIALGVLVIAVLLVLILIFFLASKGDNNKSVPTVAPSSLAAPSLAPQLPPSGSVPPPAPPIAPSADYCTNSQIAVYVIPDKTEYNPEDQPQFTIVVTNIGTIACTRDMGTGVQKVSVNTNDPEGNPATIWNNTDCSQEPGVDMRQLQPGQQEAFKIAWTKYDSAPQCTTERKLVPAGNYIVTAQVGDKVSEPTPFTLK